MADGRRGEPARPHPRGRSGCLLPASGRAQRTVGRAAPAAGMELLRSPVPLLRGPDGAAAGAGGAPPRTVFQVAHVGGYAENLGWVADQLLRPHPNVFVDISERTPSSGATPHRARWFLQEFRTGCFSGPTGRRLGPGTRTTSASWRPRRLLPHGPEVPPRQGRWNIHGVACLIPSWTSSTGAMPSAVSRPEGRLVTPVNTKGDLESPFRSPIQRRGYPAASGSEAEEGPLGLPHRRHWSALAAPPRPPSVGS